MTALDQAAYACAVAEIQARYPLLQGMVGPDLTVDGVAEQWDKRAAELRALDAKCRASSVDDRQEATS